MTTLPIKMRQSVYPMISVDQALALVLQETKPLEIEAVEVLSSCGRILAEQIKAIDPFPSFRASIMDGYAVFAPISANSCRNIQQSILAGDNSSSPFDSNFVTYITTGARVPDGANSVVKIEDTEQDPNDASGVRFKYDVFIGANIREIGSDISKDDVIVDSNEKIETAEIGLLASAGVTMVRCYKKPIIGVMSTGDELVEPWEMPSGSQVRDSNRAALIAGLRYDRFEVIDLGIVKDTATSLESTLSAATSKCDVIITSGGVSMGEADLVKPTLEKLGTVHFGRMNMKPGKPTTFAIIPRTGENLSGSSCIVFGLPGNPVSCLVTKSLLIEPCLRRLQGLPVHQCMPPQIAVTVRSTLKLDPERPEYHRAHLSTDLIPTAESTGNQRSSRLLSMRSSNALLCLPQGGAKTVINQGEVVTAIVTGQLSPPSQLLCYHKHAVSSPSSTLPVSTTTITSPTDLTQNSPAIMRVGLLTISDRASQGVYEDLSGPEMRRLIALMNEEQAALCSAARGANAKPSFYVVGRIDASAIVSDEIELIQAKVLEWADTLHLDLILTSGGTGFGRRDLTPEAIRPLLHREAPGVAQALLAEGLKHTPLAVLSRPVAGTRGNTFICTLPGSVKAVRENFQALKVILPRVMELLQNDVCSPPPS